MSKCIIFLDHLLQNIAVFCKIWMLNLLVVIILKTNFCFFKLMIMQGFSFHLPHAVLTLFLWMVRLIGVQVQPALQGQKFHKDRGSRWQDAWQPSHRSAYHIHRHHLAHLRARRRTGKKKKGNRLIVLMPSCGCQLWMHSRVI